MEHCQQASVYAGTRRPDFFRFDRYTNVLSGFGVVVCSIGTKALIAIDPIVNDKLVIYVESCAAAIEQPESVITNLIKA